jgi:hypothetical protein
MWRCVRCGETVEDNFSECWNCRAGKDGLLPEGYLSAHEIAAAENRAIVNTNLSSVNCVRCANGLEYRGMMRVSHSPVGLTGVLFAADEDLSMYACPRCGHIEFFVPGYQN